MVPDHKLPLKFAEISRDDVVSKGNRLVQPRDKMESESMLGENIRGNSVDKEYFESEIEEAEAQIDLEQLALSDDEFFVDLEQVGSSNDVEEDASQTLALPLPNVTQPVTVSVAGPVPVLVCSKCQRTYKRQQYLKKHEGTCKGKTRKTFQKTPKPGESVYDFKVKVAGVDHISIVKEVLQQLSTDAVLGLFPDSPGWKTQQMAKLLCEQDWGKTPWNKFSTQIFQMVTDAMEKANAKSFSCAGALEMLSAITTGSISLREVWFATLQEAAFFTSDLATANNLLQHLLDGLIPAVGQKVRGSDEQSEKNCSASRTLTQTEKEVLHYALGYTIRKLQRKFQRNSGNKAARLYLDIVGTWGTPNQANDRVLSHDVTQWTKTQDRGGLLHCSADYFQFMKVVEGHLQPLLNRDTVAGFAGQNIIPVMLGHLKNNSEVQKSFRALIGYTLTSDNLCEGLLDEVLTCWVNAKCRQVVRTYTYSLKVKGHGSRMGTPAMRKTLDCVKE